MSQDLLGVDATDDTLAKGWDVFMEHMQKRNVIVNARPGSTQEGLLTKVEPNLQCFEFTKKLL